MLTKHTCHQPLLQLNELSPQSQNHFLQIQLNITLTSTVIFPKQSFPPRLPTKSLYAFLIYTKYATCLCVHISMQHSIQTVSQKTNINVITGHSFSIDDQLPSENFCVINKHQTSELKQFLLDNLHSRLHYISPLSTTVT